MALSLHTTKEYKIKYGETAVCGWDEIDKFLKFLRKIDGVYINEEETYVEIPFPIVDELRTDATYGKVFETIWNESDHTNEEAHLEIW